MLNIGNHRSERVSTLIGLARTGAGPASDYAHVPRPPADVQQTFAVGDAIAALTGFSPSTSLAEGIPRFVAWFRGWHGIDG